MEVIVEHLGGVQFEIKARQHRIACDQPAENGGFDEGMTPPELLLASLGSCAGFYAAQYLKKVQPGQMSIIYRNVGSGAAIDYIGKDAATVTAIHDWFDALLSDDE